LERFLKSDEVVHHKDGNKLNNKLENLEIISQSQHTYEHLHPSGPAIIRNKKCRHCKETFKTTSRKRIFCSDHCSTLNQRKFNIPKEKLKELVWTMPVVQLAKKLFVSDKAIKTRCKRLGIDKPARGYWQKLKRM